MARRIPETRFDDLVDAATEVFIARGYRLTQMSHIADAVGVAKGTLYGYVESKQALFALCLRWADRKGSVEKPKRLPVPSQPPEQLAGSVRRRLSNESVPPLLERALELDRAEDARAELEAIVREYYLLNERFHRSIKLLDRCADFPAIAEVWRTQGRIAGRVAFARYIESRIAAGQFRPVPNVRLAARMVIEVVATWAVHIRWDRAPEDFDPVEAREYAVEFVVNALVA